MLVDSKNNRIITEDGYSVMSEYEMARYILLGTEHHSMVFESDASHRYDEKYQERTSLPFDDVTDSVVVSDHNHTQENIDELLDLIGKSGRLTNSDVEVSRIEEELDFFDRENHILFILQVRQLIDKFKRDNVVWGVGRGSSCASFVLYLLEVHDVNPITFDIPFSEMSKESL